MPTKPNAETRISLVKLTINGDSSILVPANGDLFIDPNAEPWPEHWAVKYGKDGSAILEING